MHRWRVGDVDVVRIEDTDFALPTDRPTPAWFVPAFAPKAGEVGIAFTALAIRSSDTRIVVDPWMANDGPREGADPAAHVGRLLYELDGAGFAADDIDVVVNTHLDGIGWNTRPSEQGWVPSFPNARYLYPAAELASIDAGAELYGVEGFNQLRAQVTVEGVHAPATLTPSVTLVDAPGHNAGHLAVRIEDGGALAIYAGHLVLSPFQVAAPDDPRDDGVAGPTAVATRRAILDELAAREGVLLTTLVGGAGGGVVRPDGVGFRLEPVPA